MYRPLPDIPEADQYMAKILESRANRSLRATARTDHRETAVPMISHLTSHHLPPLNVLVAEDGLANRVLVQGLLQRDGHRVTFAENGLHAVGHLLRTVYDLVLMDIDMPILDGISATRTIRRQEVALGRRTPVVALTSNDNRDECLAAGMDGFLSKPLDLREFRRLVAALLKDRAA